MKYYIVLVFFIPKVHVHKVTFVVYQKSQRIKKTHTDPVYVVIIVRRSGVMLRTAVQAND